MRIYLSSRIIVLLIGFCAAILIGAESAEADITFGTPINLGPPINTSYDDQPVGITADGLSLYLASKRPGGESEWVDIWVSTRPTKDDPWEEPINLGSPVNTPRSEEETDISSDGLTLYIRRAEGYELTPNGAPNWDIWVSTRATTNDPWDTPVNLGSPINTPVEDMDPSISADGLTMYFSSRRSGGLGEIDLWMTSRPTINDQWSEPVNLGPPVNGPYADDCPEIGPDDLTLLFTSYRPGGIGGGSGDGDLWMSTRPTKNDPWSEPVNLGAGINSQSREQRVRISGDGTLILFESNRSGGVGQKDIWQAPILPVVDLNGDGTVDSADMCIMIDHWGESYSLCDIGPSPLGDGIVDIQDMIILAEYMFDKALAVDLCAHWKLDETEGNVAQDNIGDNDALIFGGPMWLPDMGQVNGALLMDGVDDWGITNPIQKVTDEPFRIFAWINGGAPGQVVLSQSGGVNWLCADPSEGYLMTELRSSGDDGCDLISETVITDGQWHRIGLVWDGSNRTLYVDDVVVAKDTQDSLNGSTNSLYIGTGSIMQPGTYWIGLLDDICIYVSTTGY
jgi:hypothetical protein